MSQIERIMIDGRRVDLGLGSAELVKLADARRVAADSRAIARRAGIRAKNWRLAMDKYVLPKIGSMPVDKVGSAAVNKALRAWRFDSTGVQSTCATDPLGLRTIGS